MMIACCVATVLKGDVLSPPDSLTDGFGLASDLKTTDDSEGTRVITHAVRPEGREVPSSYNYLTWLGAFCC